MLFRGNSMAKSNSTVISGLAAKRFKYSPESGKKPSILADTPPNSGLRLLAYETGNKTWVYRYRNKLTGQLKQVKIGSYSESALGLKQAREICAEYKAIRDRGGCPASELKEEKSEAKAKIKLAKVDAYTVSDMMQYYIEGHVEQNRNSKGAAEVARLTKKNITPTIGDLSAKNLSMSIVQKLIDAIAKQTPTIARDVNREIKAAFSYSVKRAKISEHINHPALNTDLPNIKPEHRVLSDIEVAKFLQWLPTSPLGQNIRDVLKLTLLTACRSGEIVCAEWKHIDLVKGTYFLKDTKTGASRTVQLSTQAIEVLTGRVGQHPEYVFPSSRSNKPILQSAVVTALSHKTYSGIYPKESLGIDNWSAHDLRRTARTGLSRLRCPDNIAEAILGHSKKGIKGTYDLHQYEDEAKEWLQVWCNHIFSLASKEQ